MGEVYGLGIEDLVFEPFDIALPSHVPQVKDSWPKGVKPATAVAMIHRNVALVRPTRTLSARLRLPEVTKTVISIHGKEPQLERVWHRRNDRTFIGAFSTNSPDLIIAPDFSVYEDDPRILQVINTKRSILFAYQWRKLFGLPVVPNLYWATQRDARRLREWARQQPEPQIVSVNLQLGRSGPDGLRGVVIRQLAEILEGSAFQVVFVGVEAPALINLIKELFPQYSILNSAAYQRASHGQEIEVSPKGLLRRRSSLSAAELLELNLTRMNELCSREL